MRNNELEIYLKNTEVKHRYVDAIYSDEMDSDKQFRSHILPERFDGIIFINKSNPIIKIR